MSDQSSVATIKKMVDTIDDLFATLTGSSGEPLKDLEFVGSPMTCENYTFDHIHECMRLAVQLAVHKTLERLTVKLLPRSQLMAVLEAVKHNVTLKSFILHSQSSISVETGVSLVEAVMHNVTLQCFTLNLFWGEHQR